MTEYGARVISFIRHNPSCRHLEPRHRLDLLPPDQAAAEREEEELQASESRAVTNLRHRGHLHGLSLIHLWRCRRIERVRALGARQTYKQKNIRNINFSGTAIYVLRLLWKNVNVNKTFHILFYVKLFTVFLLFHVYVFAHFLVSFYVLYFTFGLLCLRLRLFYVFDFISFFVNAKKTWT